MARVEKPATGKGLTTQEQQDKIAADRAAAELVRQQAAEANRQHAANQRGRVQGQ